MLWLWLWLLLLLLLLLLFDRGTICRQQGGFRHMMCHVFKTIGSYVVLFLFLQKIETTNTHSQNCELNWNRPERQP